MHIDISHLAPIEGDKGHFFKQFPCIELLVTPVSSEGHAITKPVWALLDTGADHVFIDTAYMMNEGAQPISVKTVNAKDFGVIFEAVIQIPGVLDPVQIQVCGIELDENRVPYRAVLGRQFLQHFRLEYDPRNGVHRLSLSPR